VYYHELEKFTFENARYVNAHIDYAEKQRHGDKIQKCFLAKNNQLGIYKEVINNGVLHFTDDSVHWIRYMVKDFAGNSTELMLKIKSTSNVKITAPKTTERIFDCQQPNGISTDLIDISIPPNALYDDVKPDFFETDQLKGTYSSLYHIFTPDIAVQRSYSLSIIPEELPKKLQSKACIISINEKGKRSYEGGTFKVDTIKTQTKTFGNFTVVVDTIAPKLKPAFKVIPGKVQDFSKAKTIGITATDDLSGVKKYRATIDGNWVLLAYEFKQNLLFYTFDGQVAVGEHVFMISVTDDKQNTGVYSVTFKR